MDPNQISPRLPRTRNRCRGCSSSTHSRSIGVCLSPALLVLSALVPALAAIGILRKRVWGAYGFALFLVVQAVLTPIILLRASTAPTTQFTVALGFDLVLAFVFYLAGRSLAAAGAKRGRISPWIALTCALTFPLLFVQAFRIPSGGMEPTLLRGDQILTRVFPRGTPNRGDIIVFRYPVDPRQTFVKRVIGLPGDHIKIVSQVVYRNGTPLREPYVIHSLPMPDQYGSDFPAALFALPEQLGSAVELRARDMLNNHLSNGEVVVPPGSYFVLGDNRDNSLDSRYWGFVAERDLIGKPILIYNSEVESNRYAANSKSFSTGRIRWDRLFKLL